MEGLFDAENWYPGKITRINNITKSEAGLSYVIEFDDGDVVHDIQEHELRPMSPLQLNTEEEKEGEEELKYVEKKTPLKYDNDENDDDCDFKYKQSSNRVLFTEDGSNMGKENRQFSAMTSSLLSESISSSEEETPIDEALIDHIQAFLLPSTNPSIFPLQKVDEVAHLLPSSRLQYIMYQVTLAEHIRSSQSLYMDPEDELFLCKTIRVSSPGFEKQPLSSKTLMQMITEGRARLLALIRLNFGDKSHLMIRSVLELANTYALQGLWEQAAEYVQRARVMLADENFLRNTDKDSTKSRRKLESRLVCIVHSYVRDFSVMSGGQITFDILEEMQSLLQAELVRFLDTDSSVDSLEREKISQYPKTFCDSLRNFLIQSEFGAWNGQNIYEEHPEINPNKLCPSWGDVVDFLRRDCVVMKTWMDSIYNSLAPQSLSIFQLLLNHLNSSSDKIINGGVFFPSQLLPALSQMTSAARMVVGSDILSWSSKLSTEVRVLINTAEKCLSDISLAKTEYDPHHRRLSFHLPITFEELVAKYACGNLDENVDLLQSKLLTLQGMIHVFANENSFAEENFLSSLRILESLGIDMEVISCELYNSIAQLMVTKQSVSDEQLKGSRKNDAMVWLATSDGQAHLEHEIQQLRRVNLGTGKNGLYKRLSAEELEMKAYKNIFNERLRTMGAIESSDSSVSSIEAASRYLVRALEITERCFGSTHACYGAACIAVAAVKNISGDLEETREWLSRAMRSMEKLDPLPERAVVFVKTQV